MGNRHEIVRLGRNLTCQQNAKERFSPQNTQSRYIVLLFSPDKSGLVTWLNKGSSTGRCHNYNLDSGQNGWELEEKGEKRSKMRCW